MEAFGACVVIAAIAALVFTDPYGGFRAVLHPFGAESPYPWDIETLKEKGYDMTSLLFRDREKLVNILGFATEPSTFDPRNVNLLVSLGKKTWVVDRHGTVRVGKSVARLSKGEFRALREAIRYSIPVLEPESEESTSATVASRSYNAFGVAFSEATHRPKRASPAPLATRRTQRAG